MQKKEFSTEIGGKTLTATFSDLANQANGSVLLSYGNTTVLATAVMSLERRNELYFFPLTVDYEERFYAAGAILGSRFMRREGKPSDEAILTGRVIDRTIRPLFDQSLRNDLQVIITVLSIAEDDPDILAINAASLALATSNIPWNGPVSAVRIGKHKGKDSFEVNPRYDFRNSADAELDFIISGKDGKIVMIEGGVFELPESAVGDMFLKAVEEIEKLQAFQKKIIKEIGKEKIKLEKEEVFDDVKALFAEKILPKLDKAIFGHGAGYTGMNALMGQWEGLLAEELPEANKALALHYFEEMVDEILHEEAIERNRRADGRTMDELREIEAQAGGISPVLHGTGIFYRGGTHILSALTLGGPGDSQVIEGMEVHMKKRFMHHYNFPPFSSGETGRVGNTNRRMIGHGALAERALSAVIPSQEIFPYTIRIVSESMASNGSTSMGSVCGGTLALMDGGVPIKRPVAGIAMGLMTRPDGAYKILTDIQGPEDHHGDMDFKVAGTSEGITAIQLDIKVDSIPVSILREALESAREARRKILSVMTKEIALPRPDISLYAPKILTLKIEMSKIGAVIGPGGKVINKIKEETGVEAIDILDDGTVYVTGKNGTAEKAHRIINDMTREYRVGEMFHGKVTKIFDFGALVEIGAGREGLVHVSEMAPFRVGRVEEVVSLGEVVPVIVKETDESGKIKLSIKDADIEFASRKGVKPSAMPAYENGNGGNGGGRFGNHGNGHGNGSHSSGFRGRSGGNSRF
ncbi:MAG: polyribonucleotide nucleotidyltransferase [Parcubacteria group bacterium]|nr:polyribonucleotide nucleotidyltransferase [Parcubacteria group bacterium]